MQNLFHTEKIRVIMYEFLQHLATHWNLPASIPFPFFISCERMGASPVSNQTLPSPLGNLCVHQSFLFLFCSSCLDFWNSLKDTVSTPSPFILLFKKLTFTFTSSSKCLSQPGLQERTRLYRIGFDRLLFFFFKSPIYSRAIVPSIDA